MTRQILPSYQVFHDASGNPLSNGYIYIGVAGLNPETNPSSIYWDELQTIPATQPIRTIAGRPSHNGSPEKLYIGTNYSITVKDQNGNLIYSSSDDYGYVTDLFENVNYNFSTVALLLADTAMSYTAGAAKYVAAGDIVEAEGFRYEVAASGATDNDLTTSGGVKLYALTTDDGSYTVKAFGAVGDGVTDDTAAIQAAIDSGASTLVYPDGTYLVDGLVLASFQAHVSSEGGARINTSGVAFTWGSTTQYVTFDGLGFGGTGKAIYNSDPSYYATAWKVQNCQFGNTLEECFYGTTLLSLFENNLFGANYGALAAQNRHIYLRGTVAGGLAINQNIIRNNRFFRANGSGTSAVFIEFGNNNLLEGNTFEECYVTPLILDRAGLSTLTGNWFESNNVANQVLLQNTVAGSVFYKNHVVCRENSFLLLNAACLRVFDMDANSEVVSVVDNNFLTTSTPTVSQKASVVNAGIERWGTNTFDGSWVVAKSNLISNGDATSGTTGWTPVFATLAAITGGGPTGGNYFELTATSGANQRMEQVFTSLKVGQKYTASWWVKSGTSGNEAFLMETLVDYTRNSTGTTTASWVKHTIEFIALDTFGIFRLYKNTATIGTMLFGDIAINEVIE
ncbi:MAG: hypothetical protein EP341_09560 [Sphingomonadales bacterium]|nr:MAG: hypothetical protein EP341_09560 [Sphingomonadales bacterium]